MTAETNDDKHSSVNTRGPAAYRAGEDALGSCWGERDTHDVMSCMASGVRLGPPSQRLISDDERPSEGRTFFPVVTMLSECGTRWTWRNLVC